MYEIFLAPDPIDEARFRADLGHEEHGAVVCFSGVVRRTEGEQALRAIDYEAYASMAQARLVELLEEAEGRWTDFHARVVHRTGQVAVGEAAVWVGVATGHRVEAFELCRFLIDELKLRVPIWKREHLPLPPLDSAGAAD